MLHDTTADATPAGMVDDFSEHRAQLFGIAYRLLGSVAEAEDLLQEAYLRWQTQPRETVDNPAAWLVTTVTRLGIDELRRARRRREHYVGVWLPEPIVDETVAAPDLQAARADSLGLAFIHVLETLGPVERAVFLLRDVFDYDYDEIARIVERTEIACRQLLSRARSRLAKSQVVPSARTAATETIVRRFMQACATGDVGELLELLDDDAILYADGGGRVRSALRPIVNADRISRFYAGIHERAFTGAEMRMARVNGEQGYIIRSATGALAVTSLTIENGKIRAIRTVMNPDKLPGIRF